MVEAHAMTLRVVLPTDLFASFFPVSCRGRHNRHFFCRPLTAVYKQPLGAPLLLPVTSPWDSSNPVRSWMSQTLRRLSLRPFNWVVPVLALALAVACGEE